MSIGIRWSEKLLPLAGAQPAGGERSQKEPASCVAQASSEVSSEHFVPPVERRESACSLRFFAVPGGVSAAGLLAARLVG